MLAVLLFVCLVASTIGAIVGAGGGVIIKPVLDAFGVLPVSTVSFLSSVTVLCMSVSSLIRTRNNGVKLSYAVSTPLQLAASSAVCLERRFLNAFAPHLVWRARWG